MEIDQLVLLSMPHDDGLLSPCLLMRRSSEKTGGCGTRLASEAEGYIFLVFIVSKRRPRVLVLIRRYCSIKTTFFSHSQTSSNYWKLMVFLETAVILKYFKNPLLANTALMFKLSSTAYTCLGHRLLLFTPSVPKLVAINWVKKCQHFLSLTKYVDENINNYNIS